MRPDWREEPPVDELIDQARKGQIREKEFDGICRTWPNRAFRTLRKLADAGHWPPVYWRPLLWSTNSLRREGKIQPSVIGYLASLLLKAPDRLHAEIGSAISSFIEDLSEECPVEAEETFRELWNKAWGAVTIETDVDTDDVLSQALNSAAGRLAESAFNRLWKYQPETGKGIPKPVHGYFESVAKLDAGHLGRVMLATKLSNLFAIAPDWTGQSLLPYMHWETYNEARDLWTAYAWAARAGPNLFATIKSDLITAFKNYPELGEQRTNLVYLFLAASLDANSIITSDEIHGVMANLPEDGLTDVADFFEKRLGDDEGEQASTWENICLPWLRAYWPNGQERNTTSTSIALVRCLIKTGEAFPAALQWAEEFLRPGTDHVLWQIQESGLHRRWPVDMLKMLATTIPDNNVVNWDRHTLREILDDMHEADQSILQDQRFLRLYRL